MGTTSLADTQLLQERQLVSKLTYIDSAHVPLIGQAEIFRFNDTPYDHIIKHVKVFIESNPASKAYRDTVEKAAAMQHQKNIAQIHYHQVDTTTNMCIRYISIKTYCNYYAITLEQVIAQRKKDDIRFTEGETWYVLKSLLEVSAHLKANDFYFGAYQPPNITLSAEGYIKLYTLQLTANQENKNSPYYSVLHDRGNVASYLPLPCEYLSPLKQGISEVELDTEKEDSFYIGMVIMEMLIDENVKKYYSFSHDSFCVFKRETLDQDINLLKHVYGKMMMNLVANLLAEDPKDRPTPTQAALLIAAKRDEIRISGSLRMFEDEGNQIKPKMSYRTSVDGDFGLRKLEQNILESKLNAGPIKTLTKKNQHVNKSVCGVSLTSSKRSNTSRDFSFVRERKTGGRGTSVGNGRQMLQLQLPR